MKTLLLATCVITITLAAAFAQPAVVGPTRPAPPLEDLARLKMIFETRQAEALRPVVAWYRAQLQQLERAVSDQSPESREAVAQAMASMRQAYWENDQPELRHALLAAPWLWRSDDDANGVEVGFLADGTVAHVGMHGTWRISGPCEVTIRTDDDEQFLLRFNASLSAYEADRRNVSGHRLPDRPVGRVQAQ